MNEIEFVHDEATVPPYTPPPPTVPAAGSGASAGPPPGVAGPPEELIPGEPPSGPDRRRRLGGASLTSRIVAGVVALVIALVAIISSTTYFKLESFLSTRLDQQLQNTASGSLSRLFLNNHFSDPGVKPPTDVWAVAISSDGAVIGYSGFHGVLQLRVSAAERKRLGTAKPSTPVTVRTTDGEVLRVETSAPLALTTSSGADVNLIAVVGLSTRGERDTLRQLVFLELVIGSGAVIVAILATTYGVRLSLRGLRRVTTTAQDVAAELSPEGRGLDRRVPVREEGTEVQQLAESMNTLLSAVETQFAARLESERRMRQFMADASHELRTPLTSIRGYAELARMQRAVGETVEDNLSRIESEGTRMSRLVEDLLTLARGDADGGREVERELIDVRDLLDDAASGARAAFPEREIGVELPDRPYVVGDRDQLLRVIRNLVTNAAVHTQPGRPIRVLGWADEEGVTVQVIDGGPGLPPEEAAHVFERFWRADKARTRARGGSGLGLSIVAAMVRAHGGTVRFDSSVEGGSTVTVRLPGAQPA